MNDSATGTEHRRSGARPAARRRLKAIICRTGQDGVMDSCMLMLGREIDVEHVPTLAEAMERCLIGRADILFVNILPISASELTALSMFRDLAPDVWVVALASEEIRATLVEAGIADEVLTTERAGRTRPRSPA